MTLRSLIDTVAFAVFVAVPIACIGEIVICGITWVARDFSNQRVLGACSVYSCDVGTPAVVTYPLKSSAWHCACVAGGLP